jgi:hypothetical protein
VPCYNFEVRRFQSIIVLVALLSAPFSSLIHAGAACQRMCCMVHARARGNSSVGRPSEVMASVVPPSSSPEGMMRCHHAAPAGLPRPVNHCRQRSCCHQVRQDFVAPPVVRAVLSVALKIGLPSPSHAVLMNHLDLLASGLFPAPFKPPRA